MSETKKIWLDGAIVDESEAKISVFDHGLLYGDGIFEGIRFYNGRVFRLEEHVERLFLSAKAILLKMPWTEQEVIEIVCDTIRANCLTDGYVRLVVTRGSGGLGLNPYLCKKPSMRCCSRRSDWCSTVACNIMHEDLLARFSELSIHIE